MFTDEDPSKTAAFKMGDHSQRTVNPTSPSRAVVQHERDREDNAHQAGERNHVRREPGRVNGAGQCGPEFIEEEALQEREGRALVLVGLDRLLGRDGAAEEPGDEEHSLVATSGCATRYAAGSSPRLVLLVWDTFGPLLAGGFRMGRVEAETKRCVREGHYVSCTSEFCPRRRGLAVVRH